MIELFSELSDFVLLISSIMSFNALIKTTVDKPSRTEGLPPVKLTNLRTYSTRITRK